jgi:adenylate cyclase
VFGKTSHSQPQRQLFRKFLFMSLLYSAIIIFAACLIYKKDGFLWMDHVLYDLHFEYRGPEPTSGKIVLVLMNQRSADELNRLKGTWSRGNMARALENLCGAGADVIGLDKVLFAHGVDESEDLKLAAAIEDCGNVVLAKFVATEGRSEVNPLPIFQDGMIGDGFINIDEIRDDGVLRTIPFFSVKPVEGGREFSPSFSLEVARAFLNLDFILDFSHEKYLVLGAPEGPNRRLPFPHLRINFAGGDSSFTRLSYVDVVRNRFSPHQVKGKIVLMGSTLATDDDFFWTPFSGVEAEDDFKGVFGKNLTDEYRQKTSGVACHAHAVETLLQEKYINPVRGEYVVLMIIFFGISGLVFYPQRPGVLWGLVVFLSSGIIILLAAHLLFVKSLMWIEVVPILAILAVQYISGIGFQRAYSRRNAQIITGLFGKYVSRGVVDNILKGKIGVSLEGTSVEVTVLFSDLRSFTSLSESLSPRETGLLLNTYFDAMIPSVFKHGGTLDKLIGDAIMAFFGAPAEIAEHPAKAAETALDMVKALKGLRSESSIKGVDRLAMGIGLNTGVVTAGNLGSQTFMDYTVIGDTVNLASRLEGLTKHYGVEIVLSGETATNLDSRFALRELDVVRVKGRDRPVTIYELMGLWEELDLSRVGMAEVFEGGLQLFKTRKWKEAEEKFREALEHVPDDGPSRLYIERTRRYLEAPPPESWECVTVFENK